MGWWRDADLLGLGFTRWRSSTGSQNGRLHPISRGVYAVGTPLTPHGRWMAAVLACGDGAALSHRSAAELWGIGTRSGRRIDVTIRRRGKIRGRDQGPQPALPTRASP